MIRIGAEGPYGVITFLVQAIWPIVLLYILFLQRGLGAGDIKLFSVISTYLDYPQTFFLIITSFFFGAIFSLIRILSKNQMTIRMRKMKEYALECVQARQILEYKTLEGRESYIEFSEFILYGTVVTLVGEIIS